MYVFGHLGLGLLCVKPWWRKVPLGPLFFGAMFPDLLDKPIYYAACWITGRKGAELGLISGTRTFGHTLLLFLLVSVGLRLWRRSWAVTAFALGWATHLLFDNLGDIFASLGQTNFQALLWPCSGWRFPIMPYPSFGAQLGHWADSRQLFIEGLGLTVLVCAWWLSGARRRSFLELLRRFRSNSDSERV